MSSDSLSHSHKVMFLLTLQYSGLKTGVWITFLISEDFNETAETMKQKIVDILDILSKLDFAYLTAY